MMIVRICRFTKDAVLPTYATDGSAGMDLYALEPNGLTLHPGQQARINTGIGVEVPEGHEGQIRPRSGFALKGVTVINAPGTIDSDYRGAIQVLLINHGPLSVEINNGDRIAQLVIAPVVRAVLCVVTSLGNTRRADGGFGSSGR